MSKVLQSPFEKAVIDIVQFLSLHWEYFQKFRHKGELIKELGLDHRAFNMYEKADRNIPKNKYARIRHVLINEYNVNPGYLDKQSGPMFLKEIEFTKEQNKIRFPRSKKAFEQLLTELEKLKAENKALKKDNKELKHLLSMQKDLIKRLQEDIRKSAKNSAKAEHDSDPKRHKIN